MTQEIVAEAYLKALSSNGIRFVFANGGTDFAPIIEGLVRSMENGAETPRFITVPHENVAMAMADGFYKISGEPAAVMVHVTVGTANALTGIMNAARDNTPVLLAAGRTPVTESGHAGSRNIGIHWGQENFDQGGILREHVKWDYELRAGQPVNTIVGRALDIAMSAPRGPVYLTLPREVLGDPVGDPGPEPRGRVLGSKPAQPSAPAIEEAAALIAGADRVVVIAGRAGRTERSFADLTDLAETYALGVVTGGAPSMASRHPMNLGGITQELFDWADVVVVLDAPVPWIPRTMSPKSSAKLIHIATDPMFARYPFRGYEMDLAVAGDVDLALPLLHEALGPLMKDRHAVIDRRRAEITTFHEAAAARRAKLLEEARAAHPIHPAWIAHCLNQVKSADAIIVNELGVPQSFLDFNRPDSSIAGGSAGGLGHSIGAALGAKLAAPDRQVITTLGDGSYMFNVPIACHFVARAENLPTLTMITNNSEWFAVRRATTAMYPDGSAARANILPAVNLTPSPNYEKIVTAVDGYGEKVEDPAQVPAAIERGLQAVENGDPAVLNLITRAGGRD